MIRLVIAWFLVACAIMTLGRDAFLGYERGHFALAPLGEIWYAIDRGSLNLVQAVVERYVHPFVWDPVLFTIIGLPAAPFFAFLALILFFWVWRSRQGRRRWRR